jgi:hypothetical protein
VPSERHQFRLLHRDFLFRMVDLELLSSHGDVQKLLGQFGALLGAFSFVLAVLLIPRYAASRLSESALAVAAWGDEEFLISTTMAIAGLFAVVAWNAVLPDRPDSLILGPLPIRTRTVFAAKMTAALSGLGISILAVNAFTGISFPPFGAGLRGPVAYWMTMGASGLFVFGGLLAVQGVAAQVLSYRLFLGVSGVLQLVAFFAILSLYFLTPPLATPHRLGASENQRLLAWLPSFWFLGLFQELHGAADPVFVPLAARAIRSLLIVLATGTVSFALMYFRHMRRIVEQPDIAPGDRRRTPLRFSGFPARMLARPIDRAILLFTARTVMRSRQHRFLLAVCAGLGLAIAFAYAKDLIYGASRSHWHQVTVPGLTFSLVLLAFAVIGARVVFTLPVSLRANWIFRVTAVHRPATYFAATRKCLLGLAAVPLWLVSALTYFAIWPARAALEHVTVLVVVGILLVDLSLYQFRKIPFTCSYVPGKANLKVTLGVYAGAFLGILSAGTALEFVAMQKFARFAFFLAVLAGIASWAWRRRGQFAAEPHNPVQFEDLPIADVVTLDLSGDGVPGENRYLDSTGPVDPALVPKA